MLVEKRNYQGWPNSYYLSNGDIELVITSDIGPRILRYGFTGGQNLFHNFAGSLGGCGEATWQNRGGHRLWVAPENPATTKALDNAPVRIALTDDGVIATQEIEPETGLQKEIAVEVSPTGSRVTLRHRISNRNPWAIFFAPWALTVMAPGGVAICGFPPRCSHQERLLPTNSLAVWGYTDLSDPRWRFTHHFILLRQDPTASAPQKIGLFNEDSWVAYQLHGELFIKRATAAGSLSYPDFGCSVEVFTNSAMLELETLGPLSHLEPGAQVEHVEQWSLHKTVPIADCDDYSLVELFSSLRDRLPPG